MNDSRLNIVTLLQEYSEFNSQRNVQGLEESTKSGQSGNEIKPSTFKRLHS